MRTILLATLALAAVPAFAQHEGDILLKIENNAITTNLGTPPGDEAQRVFESHLGEIAPDFSDEPGFDNLPATFSPGSALGFRVRKALRVWQGNSFTTIATPRMAIETGPLSRETPLTDTPVEGFTLEVGSNGQWHHHYGFTLLAPATTGTYLLELELLSTQSGLADSQPFWIIFDQGLEGAEIPAARAWVRRELLGLCPADFDDGSSTGTPDGGVTIDDLLYYLDLLEAGDPAADLDDGSSLGVPDQGVTVDDLLYFLTRFELGC
jgi:hypothetical protein